MGGFGERKRKRKKIYNYIIILKNKEIIFKNLSLGVGEVKSTLLFQ